MTSKYISKEPCPECQSKDNVAVYDDGHKYCFGCGWQFQPPKDKPIKFEKPFKMKVTPLLPFVTPKALPKRGITKETCELYDYGYAEYNNQVVQVATYHDKIGKPVAQHLRYKDKRFGWVGDTSNMQLWGQKIWRQNHGTETKVFAVITEGEVDCLTISQIQGNRFPVVSLPNG